MLWFNQSIAYLFSAALTINACLFILQLIRMIRARSSEGVSLWAFLGFLLIQLVTITHGFLRHDFILAYGTLASVLSCIAVIVAIIYFRHAPRTIFHKTAEPSLNEIIAKIPANVYWLDRDGQFLGCNTQMLELLQLETVDEYRGKTYEDLYEPEHIDVIRKTDQSVMANNKAIALEEIAYPYKVYWSKKIPLHNDNGDVIGLLGVSIDITDRKKMEKEIEQERKRAEDANQAKTEFIYNMRHDVRTPLTNMVGLAHILADREADPFKQSIVKDLLVSSTALLDLINDLLSFTNLEDNRQPINLSNIGLHKIIEEIECIMSAALRTKSLKFTIDIDSNIPNSVIGDAMRIHRILLNLIGNAVKFTDKGHIKLSLRYLEDQHNLTWIALDVEDSGIGIPPDKLEFIFGKFNRIEQSAHSKHPGSGLGLSIVKRFVEDLGGHIRVTSVVGSGSTFTCTLPFPKTLNTRVTHVST